LSALHEPLREMVRNALLFDNTTLAAERRSHEDIYYQLLSLFVAVLAAGIVLFLLLHRQILKSRRLVIQARDAEYAAEGARSELVLAIESISEGFIIYDQEDRVALFNERYKELHPLIAEVIRVGVRFEELLRHAVAKGGIAVPRDGADEWIADCARRLVREPAERRSLPQDQRAPDLGWPDRRRSYRHQRAEAARARADAEIGPAPNDVRQHRSRYRRIRRRRAAADLQRAVHHHA
jgi:hypothetical protein